MPLGEHQVWKGNGSKHQCMMKTNEMFYVPILETLQSCLENDAILAKVCMHLHSMIIILVHLCILVVYFQIVIHTRPLCLYLYRFTMVIVVLLILEISVMDKCFHLILCSQYIQLHFKSSFIMMIWSAATPLAPKLKPRKSVC